MKLFEPKELKKIKDKEQTELARKGIKIASLVDKENKRLILVKKECKEDIEKIQKDFNAFVIKTNSKKKTLENEVIKLEKRKDTALEPLEDKYVELQKEEIRINKQQTELDDRKKQLEEEDNRSSLRDKVLITKEVDISKREEDISKLNRELLIEQKDTKAKTKDFEEEKIRWDKQFDKKVSELNYIEFKLSDRQKALDILEERNKQQQLEINKDRRHLESQQKTLKMAFDEARRKNLL